jgi:hypothetical protein
MVIFYDYIAQPYCTIANNLPLKIIALIEGEKVLYPQSTTRCRILHLLAVETAILLQITT